MLFIMNLGVFSMLTENKQKGKKYKKYDEIYYFSFRSNGQ